MKKIYLSTIVLLLSFLLTGCDIWGIDELKDKVNNLEDKVAKMEKKINQLNSKYTKLKQEMKPQEEDDESFSQLF